MPERPSYPISIQVYLRDELTKMLSEAQRGYTTLFTIHEVESELKRRDHIEELKRDGRHPEMSTSFR